MRDLRLEERLARVKLIEENEKKGLEVYDVPTYKGDVRLTGIQIMQIANIYMQMDYALDMRLSYQKECNLSDYDIMDIYDVYVEELENDNISQRIPLERAIDRWLEEHDRYERVKDPVYENIGPHKQ